MHVKSLGHEHNTMTWSGLEPRPLDSEFGTLTFKPLHLPVYLLKQNTVEPVVGSTILMITLYEVVSFQSPKFFSLSHCNFCLYQVVTCIKRSWSPFNESQWFVCIFHLACIEELLNGIIHGIIQWIYFVQMERNICNIFFLSLITT